MAGIATKADADGEVGTYYQGQGKYECKHVGVGNPAAGTTTGRFNPLSIMSLFNCDVPKHTFNDCPLPRDVARAGLKQLWYPFKRKAGLDATTQVLFELCTRVNESAATGAQEADTDAGATQQHDKAEADTLLATPVNGSKATGGGQDGNDGQVRVARD